MRYDKGTLPPTNARWSVSLYQGPDYVPNKWNRYDVAPWMPLKFNADGSLDIYIHAGYPSPEKEPNWLPAPPSGEFNVIIRNYWPKDEALNDSYKNPTIERVS